QGIESVAIERGVIEIHTVEPVGQVTAAAAGKVRTRLALAAYLLNLRDPIARDVFVEGVVKDIQHIVREIAATNTSDVVDPNRTVGLYHAEAPQVTTQCIERHLRPHETHHH